jgi:hypothetical protein
MECKRIITVELDQPGLQVVRVGTSNAYDNARFLMSSYFPA